jgi:transcription factor SPN1
MEFIDSAVLRESGLGRIVLFYSICKRVTPDISRIATSLVSTWSRPIIKRPSSFRERLVPVAQGDDTNASMRENLNSILARAKENEKGRRRTNAVMIPVAERGVYAVAPQSGSQMGRGNSSVDVDIERRRKNAERLRSLTRKVANKT